MSFTRAGSSGSSLVQNQTTEERRLITALFCDLAGFTPLSESLDPEEVRDLQKLYFDAMNSQISRYGGTVEKYAGDAVLAIFGAPTAHEDDAERAVLCGLAMQRAISSLAETIRDQWHVDVALRVGVNTGEVVTGSWQVGGRWDVDASGDAVNTAARLQTAAAPGEVLVGAEAKRLSHDLIVYGDSRELTLKGKAKLVAAFPALRVQEEPAPKWEGTGWATPMLGRSRELALLLELGERARQGDGQLVAVVGDAGVGKSRLVREAVAQLEVSGGMRAVRARCLSYGEDIGLWLISDLLRNVFGLREDSAPADTAIALETALDTYFAGVERASAMEARDVLGEVLGLVAGSSSVADADAPVRRQALIRSLRLLLRGLSDRSPALIVLEDLHWIDEASRDVLHELASSVPQMRLLIVVTHRPGWSVPWAEWSWPERISLRPLRENDTRALVGAIIGTSNPSSGIITYVIERAQGNPFFVEELVRALQETRGIERRDDGVYLVGDVATSLPSTLTEVLLARLDRLEPAARSTAQIGSVIGTAFAVSLLADVMDTQPRALEPALTGLQQAELAFPRQGADLEYVFKHVTVQEAAYHMLLNKRKKDLHLRVARAIARRYPSTEYAEIIAYHYSKTDEDAEAASWMERAGDRAAAVYATQAAKTAYNEARVRLQRLGVDATFVARLDAKIGHVLLMAGEYDEAVPALKRATEALQRAGDMEAAGEAAAALGVAFKSLGNPDEGVEWVQRAIQMLERRPPSRALALLHLAFARLNHHLGKYDESLRASAHAAQIAESLGAQELAGEAELRKGTTLVSMGRAQEACSVLENTVSMVRTGSDLDVLLATLNNLGYVYEQVGRMEDARRVTEQALEVSERVGNPDNVGFVLVSLGNCLQVMGEWTTAREIMERAVTIARSISRSSDVGASLAYLGRLLVWQGDWDAAELYLLEALDSADASKDQQIQELTAAWFADLRVRQNRPEEAISRLEPLTERRGGELGEIFTSLTRAYLQRGREGDVELADRACERALAFVVDKPGIMPAALEARGRVRLAQAELQEAEVAFSDALARARALPHPYLEASVLVHLAQVRSLAGVHAEAQQLLLEAQQVYSRLGAQRDIAAVETALSMLPTGKSTRR